MTSSIAERDTAYKNGLIHLAAGSWDEANRCFDIALKNDAKMGHAYVGKLCCELRINTLIKLPESFMQNIEENPFFPLATYHAEDELRNALMQFNDEIQNRINYTATLEMEKKASSLEDFKLLASKYMSLGGYRDSEAKYAHWEKQAINESNRIKQNKRKEEGSRRREEENKRKEQERLRLLTERHRRIRSKALVLSAIISVIAIIIIIFTVIIPENIYARAQEFRANGQYNEAFVDFARLRNFRDSSALANETMELWLSDFRTNNYIGQIVLLGGHEWVLLGVENDRALLLSRDTVGRRVYNSERASTRWNYSDIRSWLNNNFYSRFSTIEQSLIQDSVLQNLHNVGQLGNKEPYIETTDRIFLLSHEEMMTYGRVNIRLEHSHDRWWLRTPANGNDTAMLASSYGSYNSVGRFVWERQGIRPAMWISLVGDVTQ